MITSAYVFRGIFWYQSSGLFAVVALTRPFLARATDLGTDSCPIFNGQYVACASFFGDPSRVLFQGVYRSFALIAGLSRAHDR